MGGGGGVGVGGGWEAKGGLKHPLAQGKSRCVFNKAQKHPQCTCQDKTVAGSSLTPHAALLVHPSDPHKLASLFLNKYVLQKRILNPQKGFLKAQQWRGTKRMHYYYT